MEPKMVILVRNDLALPKGKLSAQTAHAAVEATLKALKHRKEKVKEWHQQGQKKIILKVPDEKALLKYLQNAKDIDLNTALITDAGRTVVAPGTKTCIAIGPDEESKIDSITGKLPMM